MNVDQLSRKPSLNILLTTETNELTFLNYVAATITKTGRKNPAARLFNLTIDSRKDLRIYKSVISKYRV